jgi:DNA-binding CsgD family transcriptional regulator
MAINSSATKGFPNPISTRPLALDNHLYKSLPASILFQQQEFYYVCNYARDQYLYIHPSLGSLLGREVDDMLQQSPTFFWHENDKKVFDETVLPETMHFLKRMPVEEYCNFLFSFNFRMLTENSNYITLLQRCIFHCPEKENDLVVATAFLCDITNFKDDTRIIYTIERLNEAHNNTTVQFLYKSVHYPEKCFPLLSKREFEILEGMYEGLSSKKIADKFCISNNTVNNHRKNILCKTKTTNIVELMRFVQKNGLFQK